MDVRHVIAEFKHRKHDNPYIDTGLLGPTYIFNDRMTVLMIAKPDGAGYQRHRTSRHLRGRRPHEALSYHSRFSYHQRHILRAHGAYCTCCCATAANPAATHDPLNQCKQNVAPAGEAAYQSESLKHEQESHKLHTLRAQNCKTKAGKVDASSHDRGPASLTCFGLNKLAVIGQSVQSAVLQCDAIPDTLATPATRPSSRICRSANTSKS
jgi:hypothetical protein